ncbi:hypothetical protein QVD17_25071 [Tagetes erecta]|uniref:Uncharacterized protein n=1 Tax=Tagetes erecta TaxID=13708 RepID=A0AAD8KFR8_TARER|nr:hypothetical protein QVD17_25071 [Tagetes erecta]
MTSKPLKVGNYFAPSCKPYPNMCIMTNVVYAFEGYIQDWKGPAKDKPRKDYSCKASGSQTRSYLKRSSDGRAW